MVVTADGISHGTIGGSLLEAKATESARLVLTRRRPEFIEMDLDTSAATGTGMVCGGKAVVLLDYLPPDSENKSVFDCWKNAVLTGTDFYFLTFVPKQKKDRTSRHALIFTSGEIVGNIPAWASQSWSAIDVAQIHATTLFAVSDGRVIVDPIKKTKTLFCFGAGHVAVPTAHIAATVGFRVMVIDDRAEFANAERFPDADRIDVTKDYRHVFDGLEIDGDSFIVIMTRGHQFDHIVLEQALKTRAGYIGMISSRHKRDVVYRALRAKGFKKQELERVHAPIGIDIGSETPEEIAVSIVAELIKVRAGQP
jgi:xanthine dehydrogenase accessory factor